MAELTDRLKQQQNATPTADDQMALLEKSYELAAKYMNGQDGQRGQIAQIPTAGQNGGGIGTPAIPVQAIRETTVSGLQQPMSDADFIRAYSQPRNYGFNTAVGTGYAMGKNTVAACIHQDQTLVDGQAERAFSLLNVLLEGGEQRIGVLALITRQYRQMLYAKDMQESRTPQAQMAKALGVPPFALSQLTRRAGRRTMAQLKKQLALCVNADFDIKRGAVREEAALDRLMLALTEK